MNLFSGHVVVAKSNKYKCFLVFLHYVHKETRVFQHAGSLGSEEARTWPKPKAHNCGTRRVLVVTERCSFVIALNLAQAHMFLDLWHS